MTTVKGTLVYLLEYYKSETRELTLTTFQCSATSIINHTEKSYSWIFSILYAEVNFLILIYSTFYVSTHSCFK